ncbi:hypothetical protein K470DRAFT_269010 [Piedraia hortae CBS 480.64]|uniref:Uncharacterized protein n=1 Tax=Piedraia hortae CBS 480.64 TaxID=1314780 RepID=A0A6A7C4G0_9PEZI|nr:hypothetical protein K470DRAFT_269010 [Piedraia hortae CBS 480.64]
MARDATENGQKMQNLPEEDALRRISRRAKELVPDDLSDDDLKRLEVTIEDVFNAAVVHQGVTYKVAAWNALCALIDRCAKTDNVKTSKLLEDSWARAFNLVIIQGHLTRPKSTRQVLGSLSSARKFAPPDIASTLVQQLLQDDPGLAKTSVIFLSHFLTKDLITLDDILAHVRSTERLLLILFNWTVRYDFASAMTQLVLAILKRSNEPVEANLPLWAAPLQKAAEEGITDVLGLRAHLLPALFRRNGEDYFRFIRHLHSRKDHRELLCASLQAGNDAGLLCETADGSINVQEGVLRLPLQWIEQQLLVQNDRISRLTGFSLLIISPSMTRSWRPGQLSLIKRTLPASLADTDSNFRGEIFSLVQRLVDRMRATTAVLARTKDPLLEQHRSFLGWLISFLFWELRPTANYQRHICSLKCLSILVRSGLDSRVSQKHLSKTALIGARWPFTLPIVEDSSLLEVLFDPFEDVRQVAASLLEVYRDIVDLQTGLILRKELRSDPSGRADRADGVAYLYRLSKEEALPKLLDELEGTVSMTQTHPVHGVLTAIRYVLDKLPEHVVQRLEVCLGHLWEAVRPVLCHDAPEGYLPEGATKETLSFCWRALKEGSLLLETLMNFGVGTNFLRDLCFTQLTELRHRGAFSTVAQTWVACCMHDRELHRRYLQVLAVLRSRSTINTRRSAGLPSLLCGILVADRSGKLLDGAYQDLEAIARAPVDAQQGSSMPQVHAMNCIKEMLKVGRLGEHSAAYVGEAMRLAADALRSDSWALRNCGLMLFRAVLDRLTGTSDDEDAKRLSPERYPQLPNIIDDLLSAQGEAVFPALQLLRHMSHGREVTGRRVVNKLLGHPSWHVRDLAARTYALMHGHYTLELLQSLSTADQNFLHGSLKAVGYSLDQGKRPLMQGQDDTCETYTGNTDAVKFGTEGGVDHIRNLTKSLFYQNPCPITQAAFLELLSHPRMQIRSTEINISAELQTTKSPILRLGLARVFAAEIISGNEPPNAKETIDTLISRDSDAAVAFFAHLQSNLSACQASSNLIAFCTRAIPYLGPVSKAAQELLVQLARISSARFAHAFASQPLPTDEMSLSLETLVIAHRSCPLPEAYLENWRERLVSSTNGDEVSRLEAAECLSYFPRIWKHLSNDNALTLALTLYDLLNDDDEEVRIAASRGASLLCGWEKEGSSEDVGTLVPCIAAKELLEFILRQWGEMETLAQIAFERHFEKVDVGQEGKADELFGKEKQNLYVDDALELEAWAGVLSRIALSEEKRQRLNSLVDGGGEDVLARMRREKARALM